MAIGVTISLTVNGFDLSVGSTATFATSLVMTMFVWYGMSAFTSIGLALLVALVVAAVNSFLIVKLGVPDIMLATLASMFIFQGVAMTYSGGGSVSQNMARLDGTITTGKVPELFSKIGQAPWIILIMLVWVFVHIFLTYTKHGRYMYAVGGNLEAARLSGIPVEKYRALAYFLFNAFRINGWYPDSGKGWISTDKRRSRISYACSCSSIYRILIRRLRKANAIGTLVGALLCRYP